MKRKWEEIQEAIRRVRQDKEPVSVDEIAHELHLTKEAVRRWGITGRRGVFLDMIRRPGNIWYTSREAFRRFAILCKMQDEATAETASPAETVKHATALDTASHNGRSYREILDAIRRVKAEGPVLLTELASEIGVQASELVNWIVRGINGHFLDGMNMGRAGWFSSRDAVQRFLEASRFDERSSSAADMQLSQSA